MQDWWIWHGWLDGQLNTDHYIHVYSSDSGQSSQTLVQCLSGEVLPHVQTTTLLITMVLIHFLVTVQKCVYPLAINSTNNQSERLVNGSFANGETASTKTHAGSLHHAGKEKKATISIRYPRRKWHHHLRWELNPQPSNAGDKLSWSEFTGSDQPGPMSANTPQKSNSTPLLTETVWKWALPSVVD